jgi:dihydroxy-acid dehydratase
VAPEAARGGPLAALNESDIVVIDVEGQSLTAELDSATIATRLAAWSAPKPHYPTGVFAKYAALVSSASDGAVMRNG